MILPTMLPAGVASGSSPDVDLIATNTDHMELQDSDTFSLLPKHNKPTSRCNRCFTRHWVVPVTLFTTLAVIALVGVLFMAFGVKKIIQSQVDQTKFSVVQVAIRPPFFSDGFITNLIGTVQTPASSLPLAVRLLAANFSVSLLHPDKELCIGWIELPTVIVAGGGTSAFLNISATARVAEAPGWAAFASDMVANPNVVWRLRGGGGSEAEITDPCSSISLGKPQPYSRSPDVYVSFMGLSYAVSVQTDITFAGFDGIPNITLNTFGIPGESPDHKSLLLNLDTSLFNPSGITLEVGAPVDFSAMFAVSTDEPVRNASSYSSLGVIRTTTSMTLVPGLNHVRLTGHIKPENMTESSLFISNYLKNEQQAVKVVGIGCSEGYSCPSWLITMISTLSVGMAFPGVGDYKVITEIQAPKFSLAFPNQVPCASGELVTSFQTPLKFPTHAKMVKVSTSMISNDTIIGTMITNYLPCSSTGDANGGNITVNISNIEIGVPNAEDFIVFVEALFLQAAVDMQMKGHSSAVLSTAIGDVTLVDIPFDTVMHLKGLEQFLCPGCIEILNTDLVSGPALDTVVLNLSMTIFNPSSATLYMGRVQMLLEYGNTVIGNGTVSNMTLYVGQNYYFIMSYFTITSQNRDAAQTFLSTFMKGLPNNVTLGGFEGSTDIIYAKRAFSELHAPATVPGLKDKLIQRVDMFISWRIILQAANMNITYQGQQVGHVNQDFHSDPITLPPYSNTLTPQLLASVDNVDLSFITSLFGVLPVDVNGTLAFQVGEKFQDVVQYSQNNVPASFNKDAPAPT